MHVRRNFVTQLRCRGVRPSFNCVASTNFNFTKLWVIELLPCCICTWCMRVSPFADSKFLLWRWTDVPNVCWRVFSCCVEDDVPKLCSPAEYTKVLIGPVVTSAAHGVALIPREVFVHRMNGVAGVLHANFSKFVVHPNVKRWQC